MAKKAKKSALPSAPIKISSSLLNKMRVKAAQASKFAYAPYSNFKVGCCVLADNGKLYVGGNVENSSYPLCLCAERNAIGSAVSDGAKRIQAVVIYTPTKEPIAPSGGNLQVIAEFGSNVVVQCFCMNAGLSLETTIEELYPRQFNKKTLSSKV